MKACAFGSKKATGGLASALPWAGAIEAVTDGEALGLSAAGCRLAEADWVGSASPAVHAVTANRELATKAAAIIRRRESCRVIESLPGQAS